jgi:hypothetical protein
MCVHIRVTDCMNCSDCPCAQSPEQSPVIRSGGLCASKMHCDDGDVVPGFLGESQLHEHAA